MTKGTKRKLQVDSGRELAVLPLKLAKFVSENDDHAPSVLSDEYLNDVVNRLTHDQPKERVLGAEMILQAATDDNLRQLSSDRLGRLVHNLTGCLEDRCENVRIGAVDALWHLTSLSEHACSLSLRYRVMETILRVFELCLKPVLARGWGEAKFIDAKASVAFFEDCFNLLTTICGTCPRSTSNLKTHKARFTEFLVLCLQAPHVGLAIAAGQFLSILSQNCSLYRAYLAHEPLKSVICDHLEGLVYDFKQAQELAAFSWLYLRSMLLFTLVQHANSPQAFVLVSSEWTKERLLRELAQMFVLFVRKLPGVSFAGPEKLAECEESKAWSVTSLPNHLRAEADGEIQVPSLYGNADDFRQYFIATKRWWLTKRNLFELLTILTVGDEEDDEEEYEEEEMQDNEEPMNIDQLSDEEAEDGVNHQPPEISLPANLKLLFEGIPDFVETLMAEYMSIETAFGGTGPSSNVYFREFLSISHSYKVSILALLNNLASVGYLSHLPIANVQAIWAKIVASNSFGVLMSGDVSEEALELAAEAMNTAREMLLGNSSLGEELTLAELGGLLEMVRQQIPTGLRIQLVKVVAIFVGQALKKGKEVFLAAELTEQLLTIPKGLPTTESNLVLNAEVLDSLIDLFSSTDESRVELVRSLKLGTRIRQAGIEFRRATKSKRISSPVVDTVRDNILNFASYLDKL